MSENSCCCGNDTEKKKTMRDEKQKKLLINRLKRIEGQIRGLENMVEQDAYCNDILLQSQAASAALTAFSKEILAQHIHGCVTNSIQNGDMEIADELIETVQKFMK